MKKWIIVALVILLITLWWARRRTSDENYTLDEINTIIKPGGISMIPVAILGLGFLTNPIKDIANNILAQIPSNRNIYLPNYDSDPIIPYDDGSARDRFVIRAAAVWPLYMIYVCESLGISAQGGANITQAAQICKDILATCGFKDYGSPDLTNINSLLSMAGKSTYTDANQFVASMSATTLDDSSKYILGFMYGGFKTWVGAMRFDTGYQPIPIVGSSIHSPFDWYRGLYMVSPGRKFFTIMQDDGNLVTYHGSNPISDNQGNTTFSAVGWGAGTFARLQDDGNFVLMYGSNAPWRASSNGGTGPWTLSLDDNGALKVIDATGHVNWNSNPALVYDYTKFVNMNAYSGQRDIGMILNSSADACAAACGNDPACHSFMFARNSQTCYKKSSSDSAVQNYDGIMDAYLTYQNPYTQFTNTDKPGNYIKILTYSGFNMDDCLKQCDANPQCEGAVWGKNYPANTCWLKGAGGANTTTGTTHDMNRDLYVNTKKWVGYARNEPANAWDAPPAAAKARFP